MSPPEKKFISTTNIGGKEEDELRPRIETEYTTEKQAIRKMMIDYYSDKPFKDVNRFPAQILKVLTEADFKRDNYINNLAGVSITPSVLERAKSALGFGDKRYKARVLDLDLALPAPTNEGSKDIKALTHKPKDKTESDIIRNNILIDHIYTTEFIPKDSSIVCGVGDIVVVTFDNNTNRTFGIIEKVLASGDQIQKVESKEAEKSYSNPSSIYNTPPSPILEQPSTNTDQEYIEEDAWVKGKKLPNKIKLKKVAGKYLRIDAAMALEKLLAAAKADSINLQLGAGETAFRKMSDQIRIYNQRYTPGYLPDVPIDIARKKNVQKPNVAAAAYPGTSNHQNGLAIDFNIPKNGWNTKEYKWLEEQGNGKKFGFSNEEGKAVDEAWHWVYIG